MSASYFNEFKTLRTVNGPGLLVIIPTVLSYLKKMHYFGKGFEDIDLKKIILLYNLSLLVISVGGTAAIWSVLYGGRWSD